MKFSRIKFSLRERNPRWRGKCGTWAYLLTPRSHLQTGFTLAELMIVIAIVAILAGVTGVALNTQLPRYRLRWDSRSITSSLILARMKATSTGLQHAINFDLDDTPQKYTLQQGNANTGSTTWTDDISYIKEMSPTVSIDRVVDNNGTHSSGTARIIFNPTGSSGTGEVYVGADAASGYSVILTPTTGRVQTIKGW